MLIIGILLKNNSLNQLPDNVSITQYQYGISRVELNKINIENINDIKELSKYVEKLKPLTASEMVDLSITKENILSLSKMLKGLYEWVKRKLQ